MSQRREVILVVDDEEETRQLLAEALAGDFEVLTAATAEQARMRVDQGVSLVLVDNRLGGDEASHREGLDLLGELADSHPSLPVVLMTGYADIETAVEAMKLGAADFVQKNRIDTRVLGKDLMHNIDRFRLRRRVEDLESDLKRLEPWEMVGDDPQIQDIRSQIELVARDGYSSVLITGATGTGKELVARAIHSRGWRSAGPFQPVTVPALAKDVVESELFGHVKGAFTGAHASRAGYIEKADGGVLFLDEVGDLTADLQLKLLRVLETKSFTRVGSTKETAVDVQVVAATNRDFKSAIREGQIREDFFYRLKTMEIRLPSLRERSGDVPLLADHFLFLLRQQGRTRLAGISQPAMKLLRRYSFPGNVRELKSIVERARMIADDRNHKLIQPEDLPADVTEGAPASAKEAPIDIPEGGIKLDEELARTELHYLETALRLADEKKTEAWQYLGLNDRFALRRRVTSLKTSFPHLFSDFPTLQKLYP
jgi:DNA-binding NtrC family response regulator